MISFCLNMLNGYTGQESFNECIAQFASDDNTWLINLGDTPNSDKVAAYPILNGRKNYTLWNVGIKNGSFDNVLFPNLFNIIIGWKKDGDARLLTKLGEIFPISQKYMAIVTTGIGSSESKYLSGTEGSSILQQFQIPVGATTLTFSYNIVSEEPMEFVGSSYDDKFSTKIYDVHGNEVVEVASESINTSTWYAVSGIDFDDGDSTAYQTGWKTVTIDVTACTGRFITLKFGVVDVGDSAYDTVALVDNIVLS